MRPRALLWSKRLRLKRDLVALCVVFFVCFDMFSSSVFSSSSRCHLLICDCDISVFGPCFVSQNNSKTCVKRPLKSRQNKDLYDKW